MRPSPNPPGNRLLWTAGLAIAAVTGIALFIALRPGPAPDISDSATPLPLPQGPAAAEETVTAEELVKAMTGALGGGSLEPSPPAQSVDADAAAGPAPAVRQQMPSSAELRDLIGLWAMMLPGERAADARQAYRNLRESCPRCDLPDTLEKAIDQQL